MSTRSPLETINRRIQARKFYATLPHKLDAAEEEFLRLRDEMIEEESQWTFEEITEGDTPLGGPMSITWNPKDESNQ